MMFRRMAWVPALLFVLASSSAAADELVVFKDYRALIVQSHRVEGDWTYLRIGSGEMAVPSATILKFDQEQGVSAAAHASYSAPPSAMTPPPQQVQPAAVIPPPFRPGFPNRLRQPPPDQPPPEDADDEVEKGDVTDEEEADSDAPADPAPTLQRPASGQMPMINPNLMQKGPIPQTQQPIDQKR